ncbi:MAG TPA: 4Fe-4S dicluster domain-containing protein, partial [Tepidisphaeraceae bacterium]|nr:4Fe-4S dicluster domain-containing protein [Tepidisphaeraceae bacterium]
AGASAGIGGCGQQPDEQIVPYVLPPEQVVAGKPLMFATAMPMAGYGKGVLVESNMGRPTKVEGNPDHPATLGASDVFMQASILDLWDPQRAQTIRQAGQISTWGAFLAALNTELGAKAKNNGAGLRILTGAVTSPTLLDQLQRLLQKFPQAKWHHYEPINSDNLRLGAKLAFGRVVQTVYHFEKAKIICALDSDFLSDNPGAVRYAREFAGGRRVRAPVDKEGRPSGIEITNLEMNRLYVAESTPSITGAMADHRVRMQARQIENTAREIFRRLTNQAPADSSWHHKVVSDLRAAEGAGMVIAGPSQPPIVHALAHAMNEMLGNVGKTVMHHEPIEGHDQESATSLRQLVADMNGGAVDTLLILGQNPIYSTPFDLNFTGAISKVRLRIQQSLYYDQTSAYCHWHIPESHYLESWSDVRAYDGTVSIIQPLISPLYQSKSAHQVLGALLGDTDAGPLPIVKEHWRKRIGGESFEQLWHESLRKGFIPSTASPVVQVSVNRQAVAMPNPFATTAPAGQEIIFRADPSLFDGRFANNGWLQELPKPLTKLTWDNAALMSQSQANELNVSNGDVVSLESRGGAVKAPVWIMPGHPDGSVTVYLGHGQKTGFDAYKLRSADSPWFANVRILRTGETYPLACTQPHQMIETASTRELIRTSTIGEFKDEMSHPRTQHAGHEGQRRISLSLFNWDYSKGHQWAMQIDNNTCIGCSACVIACQAENNIPIVGKEEVLRSREMHWLRIDTYYHGETQGDPETYFEPVPCMHCETAPCEVVCPVNATTHSAEGLNEMTYNRCIGTRYCSNNCPYKVRRFNFFQYTKPEDPTYLLRANPEVTIRERGVMEKCTYCVQRLNRTRVEVKKLEVQLAESQSGEEKSAARQLMDREMQKLQTACQQACPTQAIIFGDMNWPKSEVARLRNQPHDYALLEELNTKPRTRYLKRFINPGGAA